MTGVKTSSLFTMDLGSSCPPVERTICLNIFQTAILSLSFSESRSNEKWLWSRITSFGENFSTDFPFSTQKRLSCPSKWRNYFICIRSLSNNLVLKRKKTESLNLWTISKLFQNNETTFLLRFAITKFILRHRYQAPPSSGKLIILILSPPNHIW